MASLAELVTKLWRAGAICSLLATLTGWRTMATWGVILLYGCLGLIRAMELAGYVTIWEQL